MANFNILFMTIAFELLSILWLDNNAHTLL